MRSEYDVVVVGSGYGGGVAASRMARAGKSVAVLEMGKEKWPGEYPNTLMEALPELHISGKSGKAMGAVKSLASGKPTGMYQLILGEGQNAFVGKGLGGTSLINANVFLECDKRTLALPAWPPELRKDPNALDPYYARATEMLQPTPYPDDYPLLKKLSVLEKQAEALGQKENFYRVPQTTFFRNGLNNVGVEMKSSTGSGQDCTGVNDGSKSSVLMNYIPDAWNWGAEMFCECEVRYIQQDPNGEGYIVFYAWHGGGREKFEDAFHNDLMWVRAKELCFLGAGALGTTEILLRSRARGLKMSRLAGQKLSGNGDILSFGYNTEEIVNGVGRAKPSTESPTGPAIAGVIDNRNSKASHNVLDDYVIQEGSIPEALAPLIQSMLEMLPGKRNPDTFTAKDQLRQLLSSTETRFLGPYSKGGSINRTQTYLIMSHDSNEAFVSLEDDKLHLQFKGVGRTEHVQKLNTILAKATSAIGGTLINCPFYAAFNQQEEITVHPLGGAIMSSDGAGRSGVTNHLGQVFSGEDSEVHGGLICVDGSVIPTSLGVNPFATITALAERSVDAIAKDRAYQIDMLTKNGRLDLFGKPAKSVPLTPGMMKAQKAMEKSTKSRGVQFTEIMDGHIHIGDNIGDYTIAEKVAKGSSSSARLYLSVTTGNARNRYQNGNQHSVATGTLSCAALSRDPLLILQGDVQFFSTDENVSDGTNLAYNLTLLGTDGHKYHLNGYKELNTKMAFSLTSTWKATTTLLTTLTRPNGSLVGKGKLHISVRNFVSELKTLSSLSSGTLLNRTSAVTDFMGNFAQNTADYYLGPLRTLQHPPTQPKLPNGYLPKPAPIHTVTLTAKDGVQSTLMTWASTAPPSPHSPSRLPILMIPGASVDHTVFALPTIRTNAVDHLTSLGHTVHVLTHRFCRTPICASGGTVYEARLDVLAALTHIRSTSNSPIHLICHCMGAVSTSIGLLDGTIPAAWLAGLTCTQVFFALRFGRLNALKAGAPLLPALYQKLTGSEWFPMAGDGRAVQAAIDQALRFYPAEGRGEVCSSSVCHRFSLTYGRCWEHANLNRATHAGLDAFLGGVHMRMLRETMRMGVVGRVLDGEGRDTVWTDEGLERLRGVPMLFVSGGENVVFDPESTQVSYDVLRRKFGPGLYKRRVIAGYGHLDTWMGKDAARDVYPVIGEHLEWCEGELSRQQSECI
ncbi:glucose-methanol-choline oxidoreductase [Neofusicoccum parvum]|uniref:Glucose-methanol-choline oxidoreductase n=1 Tax=Neofusicoccum parvum TaxID=310453 RepID=A0ACB5SIM8_9PEZI|nr:glucose-methanol-choline oxidoreductase [Neofusicoccum parvum]